MIITGGLTVPIERVHPREVLLTPLTGIRANVQMQLLVTLAIVLTSEPLVASRPLALERTFFIMRPQMS